MAGIICNEISKKYGPDVVLEKFSYVFKENGLYVLFGESGCGKTTLLNMISGLTSVDAGSVIINNTEYNNQVSNKNIGDIVSYITQDSYFIDYLTVKDNIQLCSNIDNKGESYIQEFGLSDKMNQYPNELSGGERQRLAIIQAIIQKKRIIILDEPTASLDEDNKKMIFKMLNKLKEDVLIICSSHDDIILEYADEVIDFHNIEKYSNKVISKEHYDCYNKSDEKGNLKDIIKESNLVYQYVKKQRKYKKREKVSGIVLVLIIIFALGVIFYVNDYEKKLSKSMDKLYKLNAISVAIPYNDEALKQEIFNSKGISDVAYSYKSNVPTFGGILPDEEQCMIENDNEFELFAGTLPMDRECFPYRDRILYGGYYTNENQVIIGKSLAKSISNNIKDLIGEYYEIKLPDKAYRLEIVGIADFGDDIVSEYFMNSQGLDNANDVAYLNNEFLKRYENDDVLGDYELQYGQVIYVLFFDEYDNLLKFTEKYKVNNDFDIIGYDTYNSNLQFRLINAQCFFYPIIILCIIVVMIFYYEIKKIEIANKSYIFCVYQYYGYSLNAIKLSTIRYYFSEIIRLFTYSLVITLIGTNIINAVTEHYRLTDLRLFAFNLKGTSVLFIALLLLSGILITGLFRRINIKGWYGILKTRRDLL